MKSHRDDENIALEGTMSHIIYSGSSFYFIFNFHFNFWTFISKFDKTKTKT